MNCGAAATCSLGNGAGAIKHVIYLQFDNTHLLRDRAGVPSDLEQMPHVLNFIRGNGTMMANDRTVLISHTASGGAIPTSVGESAASARPLHADWHVPGPPRPDGHQ
ncbi:MAG TPA: hypothetical protein VGL13_13395 [Polyangiaceae bacterium]